MKILLIYPQYSHSSEFDSRAPSMSLFYLASTLEIEGHNVAIYDASLGTIIKTGNVFRYGASEHQVYDFLSSASFDFVGITCSFTARWKFVKKIAQQVKEMSHNTPIAVGGLFPTSEWKYCLTKCRNIDCVLLGESELTFLEIINKVSLGYNINDACKEVEGVAWQVNGKISCNPKRVYNDKLDELPFPAWHLVDLDQYFKQQRRIFELPQPCLPILSSRGCPNPCTFCNMYLVSGHRCRVRSAQNVLDEVAYLINRFGVRNFYFIDDNFSFDLERSKRICHGFIEKGFKIKYNFHNGLSIKTIDEELVHLMKKSGCTSVCLAVESGSERIRNKVYRKGLTTEKIIAGIWITAKKG